MLNNLLMRAACLPDQPLLVGQFALPPLRAILLHLLLDGMSNALPPPGAIGIEKLLCHLGSAILVATVRPQGRAIVSEVISGGFDWRQVLEYVRSAI